MKVDRRQTHRPDPVTAAPRGVKVWVRDLGMGVRFAVAGGRQGWVRTVLTVVGVALGVTMLLLAASIPSILDNRASREEARSGGVGYTAQDVERAETTLLVGDASTRSRGDEIFGRSLQPDGGSPPLPPGVDRMPEPGEIVVSPALKELLQSEEGAGLVERFDARVVGTIGENGLLGSRELAFYQGTDKLTDDSAVRTDRFSAPAGTEPMDPMLLLTVVVACAVLVMPIAVFVATAVRFGSEQRDQRLAALRLMGADSAMTRRIAAGEALVGSLLGLLLGGVFFLLGRMFIGEVTVRGLSVLPSDVVPGPLLGALVVTGVPVAAVAVSVLALRGIAIEPLGVVRQSGERRRRLWWRLLPPVAGLLALLPLAGTAVGADADIGEVQVASGVVLLLSGLALLLPWLVERFVHRLSGGPVSWQLAVRRLQLGSSTATRAVSGITIAVAGAVALQMLLAGVEAAETRSTGKDPERAQMTLFGSTSTVPQARKLNTGLNERTEGVRDALVRLNAYAEPAEESGTGASVTVADCATLRELARIGSCRDGQVFRARGSAPDSEVPAEGERLVLDGGEDESPASERDEWTVPASRVVEPVKMPDGLEEEGILATPSALDASRLSEPTFQGWVRTDPREPEAVENTRTTVFQVDPAISFMEVEKEVTSGEFVGIRRGVLVAATGVLLLIGASMVVSTLEQLRERKRQLSVLVAFGTRRSTLAASVLWQSAIPVLIGLGLAAVFGLGLGRVLLKVVSRSATDWLVFLPFTGIGLGLVALVTLASLPPLWRMMRADGLRTE